MIKENFCLVGIDNDFVDFIKRNSSLFVGYFSNKDRYYKSVNKKKRLGDHIYKKWIIIKKKSNPVAIITIDDGKVRETLIKKVFKKNCKNLILKKAYVSKTTLKKIEKKKGILIQDFTKIMSNVKIGDGTKIHIGAHVHHDNTIGKFVTIAPKAVLLGNVKIGDYSYIGANSTIICNNIIGEYAFIGAGAVVTKDVPDYALLVGNPGKIIGWVNKKGERLKFNELGVSDCGQYEIINGKCNDIE